MKLYRQLILWCTLRWVNKLRAGRGLDKLSELPKGQVLTSTDCPIARALNAQVYRTLHFRGDLTIRNGHCARKFIPMFDTKQYPELIE